VLTPCGSSLLTFRGGEGIRTCEPLKRGHAEAQGSSVDRAL